MNAASIHALIPAAGVSRRFGAGTPKQYALLLGAPVMAHSIGVLLHHPSVDAVTVVLAADDDFYDALVRPLFPDVGVVTGGPSRAHSVLNGVRHICNQDHAPGYVMVHDAARPCLEPNLIDDLVRACSDCADGAILAIPVSDTIKKGNADGLIEETVSRDDLWQAQTPQMFFADRLLEALESSLSGSEPPTDEASAMERLGARPKLVRGSAANIKITKATDLVVAEGILNRRSRTPGDE